jgi:hypothetical protein
MTAVAVVTPFLLLAGCKSGTNLIALPKMPSISWNKKKSNKDLARKGNLAPPSVTALANQNGEAPLYANREYPDTRLPAAQPGMGAPSSYGPAPSYASATSPRGGQDPYRQPDYYSPSPAYAGAGGSGGYQESYGPNYERTATLPNGAAGNTGGYDSYGRPYADSYPPTPSTAPYRGASTGRDGGYNGGLPSSTPGSPMPSHDDGSYPRPATYESKLGTTSRDGGLSTYGDPDRFGSQGVPGSSDGAIRLSKGGPNDDRGASLAPGGTCTSESCSVPAAASHGTYDVANGANWRPGGTSDFNADQWSREPTRTATLQPSASSGGYRDPSGSTVPQQQPAGGDYPYSGAPARDSGFGGSSTYR